MKTKHRVTLVLEVNATGSQKILVADIGVGLMTLVN